MRGVIDFLNRMDKTAWRAVLVTLGLFVGVVVILVLGKSGVFGRMDGYSEQMLALRGSPLGLPALVALFCLAAFIGIPQMGLIAVAVVIFGPSLGFFYSWFAALVSGTLTFWLGRLAGEGTVRRYAGDTANRMSDFIGRNAFLASAIVRPVPVAPFIVVNMAFGMSKAKFSHFIAGMAIGSIPKTAFIAFAGGSVMAAFAGAPWEAIGAAVAALAIWIALMLYARSRIRLARSRQASAEPDAAKGQILARDSEKQIDSAH